MSDRAPLQETIALLKATLDSTRDAILVVDLEQRIIFYNRRYLEMFGFTAEQLDRGGLDLVVERMRAGLQEEDQPKLTERALLGEQVEERRDVLRFKDGRVYERYVAPHRVGSRTIGRVASFRDIGPSVRTAEALEQQRAFVADASHQLRNPLAALLLRIELLAMELPEGNEEIASVRTEGKRLSQVLDDLLDLALAEHAAAELRLVDVGALTAERVASWRPVADDKGVVLTGECGAVTAWADPVALSSALDAVIDNALKFTPAGEEVSVTAKARSGGESVAVVVADHGPGLTQEELGRVGDRFWRSGRHQNIKGSGLGLSITRVLLTAGGGGIAFAPNEPHGLRVTVTVPRNPPVAGTATGDRGGRSGQGFTGR